MGFLTEDGRSPTPQPSMERRETVTGPTPEKESIGPVGENLEEPMSVTEYQEVPALALGNNGLEWRQSQSGSGRESEGGLDADPRARELSARLRLAAEDDVTLADRGLAGSETGRSARSGLSSRQARERTTIARPEGSASGRLSRGSTIDDPTMRAGWHSEQVLRKKGSLNSRKSEPIMYHRFDTPSEEVRAETPGVGSATLRYRDYGAPRQEEVAPEPERGTTYPPNNSYFKNGKWHPMTNEMIQRDERLFGRNESSEDRVSREQPVHDEREDVIDRPREREFSP